MTLAQAAQWAQTLWPLIAAIATTLGSLAAWQYRLHVRDTRVRATADDAVRTLARTTSLAAPTFTDEAITLVGAAQPRVPKQVVALAVKGALTAFELVLGTFVQASAQPTPPAAPPVSADAIIAAAKPALDAALEQIIRAQLAAPAPATPPTASSTPTVATAAGGATPPMTPDALTVINPDGETVATLTPANGTTAQAGAPTGASSIS